MKAIWCYDDFLTAEQCGDVIDYALTLPVAGGTVGNNSADDESAYSIHKPTRDSEVAWIKRDGCKLQWLFPMCDLKVATLNDAWHGVRHHHTGCDALQFTMYHPGNYYRSHVDSVCRADNAPTRKVSCSILLSDPKDFKGGDLIVDGGRLGEDKLKRGQISVFPSIVTHEVTEVTAGVRYSLVGWWLGPPWM